MNENIVPFPEAPKDPIKDGGSGGQPSTIGGNNVEYLERWDAKKKLEYFEGLCGRLEVISDHMLVCLNEKMDMPYLGVLAEVSDGLLQMYKDVLREMKTGQDILKRYRKKMTYVKRTPSTLPDATANVPIPREGALAESRPGDERSAQGSSVIVPFSKIGLSDASSSGTALMEHDTDGGDAKVVSLLEPLERRRRERIVGNLRSLASLLNEARRYAVRSGDGGRGHEIWEDAQIRIEILIADITGEPLDVTE